MNKDIQRFRGGLILYDRDLVSQADARLFDPEHWRTLSQLSETPSGRGMSWFVGGANRPWVLRHYRRGGWPGRFIRDTYLWLGESRTRPVAEWNLLFDLHAQGLPVPRPVAARVNRTGLWYTGDIITQRLDAMPLSGVLAHGDLDVDLWHAAGRAIRQLHDAGVFHADLNAHNILFDKKGRVYLIDFDKGVRRTGSGWQQRNLQRLARSLAKILGSRWATVRQGGWPELLKAYERGMSR